MTQLNSFLSGIGFTIALAVFCIGLLVRLILYFKGLDWRLDRVAYKPHMNAGMKGGLNSIFRWLIPFGTHGWRAQPFASLGFFLLHFGAVLVPLFLIAHTEILRNAIGLRLPQLPGMLADILTVAAIVGLLCLVLRRLALPQVRILTDWHDWLILILVIVPFVSGFVARMEMGNYSFWLTVHLIFGNLFLVLAPFTKLSHIALFFGSRWQLGADFAIKRGDRNRGHSFPW